ncbi:hypothetical protein PFISCL1PPCAC_5289 [Pristionchus fissidentatus]|uniref:C2H2-type domain-containing protein n=1 Tax=Pristionchus fissidentatus TaxID=1538716 RepID=A0AAV5V6T2_9BILA|nr:hypothetical protein PFISCL1PPCAC_5289 [Pristionchus fissidentatus]
MSDACLAAMDRIADMLQKVFALSSSPHLPIGAVVVRALDVMKTMAQEGIQSQSLPSTVYSLRAQMEDSTRNDGERDDSLRPIVYGLCEVLGQAVESAMEIGGRQSTTSMVETRIKEEESIEEEAPSTMLDQLKAVKRQLNNVKVALRDRKTHKQEEPEVCELDSSSVSPTTSAAAAADNSCSPSDHSSCSKPFPCSQCTATFSRQRDLLKHRSKEHNTSHPHTCFMCSRSFPYLSHWRAHVKNCDGSGRLRVASATKKPHACSLCEWSFDRPKKLQNHMLTHKGTRPHACPICPLRFLTTTALKDHQRKFHDVLPYSCECGKAFGHRAELIKHKKKAACSD